VNISSISTEIGLTLHADNVKASDVGAGERSRTKTGADKSSATNSTRSAAAELPGSGQPQSANSDNGKISVPLLVNGSGLGLKFSLDRNTDTQVIEVIDLKSGDVVRQIPPKEVINFLRAIRDNKGILLSRRL
jgi:uncharacterized FlaG/YvyC family protein